MAIAGGLALCAFAESPPGDPDAGRAIYLEGRLPGGGNLQAMGAGGVRWQGTDAACVRCHRRSGLGSYEGPVLVPPVIGPYLFRPGADNVADLDLPHVAGYAPQAAAYTEATLLQVLRSGHARGGRVLDPLMPRYALDGASMAPLAAYLRELGARRNLGVGDDQIELAVVITPQTDAADAEALLAVLQAYARERNDRMAARTAASASGKAGQYRTARRWDVVPWRLHGDSAAWPAQLEELQARQPAFALLSGLGADWRPIDAFCARTRVPCLFPVTELPGAGDAAAYFDGGVLLEAAVFARKIGEQGAGTVRRIVQVYRTSDVGEVAARELASHLRGRELRSVAWPAGTVPSEALRSAAAGVMPGDLVVLWLRPRDLALLPPPRAGAVYASGVLGGLEAIPLNDAWRAITLVSSPVDPPQRRFVRMNFPVTWLRRHAIAARPGLLQAKAWLACELFEDTQGTLLDAYVPDFLLERLRSMVSQRTSTGPYPRLGLAEGQALASKGAYLFRLDGPAGSSPQVDGGWIVP